MVVIVVCRGRFVYGVFFDEVILFLMRFDVFYKNVVKEYFVYRF